MIRFIASDWDVFENPGADLNMRRFFACLRVLPQGHPFGIAKRFEVDNDLS